MKRPRGFDRSPAPPVSPQASAPEAASVEPASSSGPAAPAGPLRSESAAEAPLEPVAAQPPSVAPPIPLLRPDPAAAPGETLYDPLPSNREINRALRAARRERRRVERDEVRRFTKWSRRRRQTWLGAAGVVAALVLGVAAAGVSPLFALARIEVTGTSRLDPAAVQQKLSGQLGTPLALLDQAAIARDLAAFPLIRSYSLERNPPDAIVVRIVERQPIGIVQQGATFTLVDAAQVPIASSAARPDGFPLIAAPGGPADRSAGSGFAAAVSVLSALPPDVFAQVDAISAQTRDDVSFTLRSGGATVVWGSAEDSALKAADLAALLRAAPGASRYDVSSPHSVTTG